VAVDPGESTGNWKQSGHHADERGFTSAVWAEQAENLSFGNCEGDVVDGGEVTVLFDDVADFNSGLVLNYTIQTGRGREWRTRGTI
jgi:hypothetical protein